MARAFKGRSGGRDEPPRRQDDDEDDHEVDDQDHQADQQLHAQQRPALARRQLPALGEGEVPVQHAGRRDQADPRQPPEQRDDHRQPHEPAGPEGHRLALGPEAEAERDAQQDAEDHHDIDADADREPRDRDAQFIHAQPHGKERALVRSKNGAENGGIDNPHPQILPQIGQQGGHLELHHLGEHAFGKRGICRGTRVRVRHVGEHLAHRREHQAERGKHGGHHQQTPGEDRKRTPADQAEPVSDRRADRESLHSPLLFPRLTLARIALPR